MQKTLFLYIFRDLLRIFLLASGALAGIMSFGGLLRPLTQHGLDLAQVGEMLGYFMPAMTNYSWPIATLFATTFVYGRLSADNELTACRAAGLTYAQILTPALLIGIVVTLLSAFFLCFVVPRSFLKAEQVIYSNLAKLVAGEIDRTQRIRLDANGAQTTIFARSAQVLEPNPQFPDRQAVQLNGVTIVSYVKGNDLPKVPSEFYRADSALAVIEMPRTAEGDVQVFPILDGGQKIPRPTTRGTQGGGKDLQQIVIQSGSAGPFTMQSPVRETTKFMDITRLLALRAHPELSRRISRRVNDLTRFDQTRTFLRDAHDALVRGETLVLAGREGDAPVTYRLAPPPDAKRAVRLANDRLTLTSGTADAPGVAFAADRATLPFAGRARELVLVAKPDADDRQLYARIETRDAVLDYAGEQTPLLSKDWNVTLPMSPKLAALSNRTARAFLADYKSYAKDDMLALTRDVVRQRNQIESELHARCSFAFSCLLLALLGAMIGMMTRSGNFVTAFAVSVGPAMIAIVLIVTGQHICDAAPRAADLRHVNDSLRVGLPVMWSGSAIVLAMGLGLYYKLSRT